eukprot:27263-Prymnesium_polylepis.1
MPTLHAGEGGEIGCPEDTLHNLISDANSRLGASWCLCKPPSRSRKCLAQNGPFEDAERR